MSARPAAAAFDAETGVLLLDTPHTSYSAYVGRADDIPIHTYWGPPITAGDAAYLAASTAERLASEWVCFRSAANRHEEYPLDGGLQFGRAALSVEFPGAVRSIAWRLARHEITAGPGHQELALWYEAQELVVTLYYRVHDDSDVIDRWVVVRNDSAADTVDVHRLDSAAWVMPEQSRHRMTHLTGRWAAETQVRRTDLTDGHLVLESRRGITGHHANPWFAIDDGTATEESGRVYSGTLHWSGSWRLLAQRELDEPAQILFGWGHEGFGPRRLEPGEVLTTPVSSGLFTADGFGAMSHAWHEYALRHVLPNSGELRPVLFNSWEATGFDVDEQGQRALARKAAALGCELFVLDDGWFGRRSSDRAGLGDWWVNTDRFPGGLKPLIDEVHALGMGFGLWIEPEMVNPDSDLYRAHPEWTYHHAGREPHTMRNQLVLNLARPDVAEWVFGRLDALLSANDVRFVKWDMNRPFTDAGWPERPDRQGRLWLDHVTGVYGVIDALRRKHPGVAFEACSGGGGRVDFGIMARTDQFWTSDNTDALDRRHIQHGFSHLYPARTMSCWVTDLPTFINKRRVPLTYRFHVAMAGVLGVGGDLNAWTAEETEEARGLIARYKEIRPIVQHGRLHRLGEPGRSASAVQYVTPDRGESVVLVYQEAQQYDGDPAPIRLRGLDPEAGYRLDGGAVLSGALLMGHGITPRLTGDYASALIRLERVNRS
ncbi:alpha-galactosidase [Nonomuraea solani]|uniref:Alpha-galactosidase n=1 Tax=Nonomuraea solani TaxID=1144553 RepID=A0A1H5XYJ9_9ACTN|nr:alpha-galactosidase [Nonomuraea solani]SEG16854.1 alpha-galactosidase [Nonomuraea solani]